MIKLWICHRNIIHHETNYYKIKITIEFPYKNLRDDVNEMRFFQNKRVKDSDARASPLHIKRMYNIIATARHAHISFSSIDFSHSIKYSIVFQCERSRFDFRTIQLYTSRFLVRYNQSLSDVLFMAGYRVRAKVVLLVYTRVANCVRKQ